MRKIYTNYQIDVPIPNPNGFDRTIFHPLVYISELEIWPEGISFSIDADWDSEKIRASLHTLIHRTLGRWQVETGMAYGWENCWHVDDVLQTFATKEEAEAELREFLIDFPTKDAGDYRVTQI